MSVIPIEDPVYELLIGLVLLGLVFVVLLTNWRIFLLERKLKRKGIIDEPRKPEARA